MRKKSIVFCGLLAAILVAGLAAESSLLPSPSPDKAAVSVPSVTLGAEKMSYTTQQQTTTAAHPSAVGALPLPPYAISKTPAPSKSPLPEAHNPRTIGVPVYAAARAPVLPSCSSFNSAASNAPSTPSYARLRMPGPPASCSASTGASHVLAKGWPPYA